MPMVKRVVLAAAVVAGYTAAIAGAAGASHHNAGTAGCAISVATGPGPTGMAGTITVVGTGLTAGKQVTMWYSVPNMAGYENIDTVAADGTIHDVSYTTYSGSWMGKSWTYSAQIWSSSTGDVGRGSLLASCSTSISL